MTNTDIQFWNGIAERYAKKPVSNVAAYERKLELTKARLRPTDVVLDIGCGTGSLALELAPRVSQVHALDLSSEMIRIANQKAQTQHVENVAFHNATLDDAPTLQRSGAMPDFASVQGGGFDMICAYNVIHLIKRRSATLDQIFSLLKPGGVFVSSTPCLGDSLVPYGIMIAVMRWFGKAPAVWRIRVAELLEEMQHAGFANASTLDVGASKTTAFVVATKPQ